VKVALIVENYDYERCGDASKGLRPLQSARKEMPDLSRAWESVAGFSSVLSFVNLTAVETLSAVTYVASRLPKDAYGEC
jgi:hypothetical protein